MLLYTLATSLASAAFDGYTIFLRHATFIISCRQSHYLLIAAIYDFFGCHFSPEARYFSLP